MATAQARAADAEPKTTMSPSPRFFTSVPPDSAMAWRRIEKWPRRSSSAVSGDRRCDSSVEPTMSVKRIATFSVVIGAVPQPARIYRRREGDWLADRGTLRPRASEGRVSRMTLPVGWRFASVAVWHISHISCRSAIDPRPEPRAIDVWSTRPIPSERVQDVGSGLLERQHHIGIELDPLCVVLVVQVAKSHVVRVTDHHAVTAVGGEIVSKFSGC